MIQRKIKLGIMGVLMIITMAGCGNTRKESTTQEQASVEEIEKPITTATKEESNEEQTMKITIADKEYEVELDNNVSVDDIIKNMPLDLEMERYAEHEYYDRLSFTPRLAKEKTSQIKAGNVYYWDGWNALVINYIDSDIDPYQVVHVGEIKDKEISNALKNTEDNISVKVDK